MGKKGKSVIGIFLLAAILFLGGTVACQDQAHPPAGYARQPSQQGTESSVGSTAAQDFAEGFTYEDALAAEYIYTGTPYVEVNGNTPFFTEAEYTTTAFETYSPLDETGRCGAAYANIGVELMPVEERGGIGMVRPTGWHTVKYAGIVEGNYLYNRCHLIAYVLSGENANEQNLVTGTRYMNVNGMLPFENQVADYVKETQNHVLYRVTPRFTGDNLLADGVLMEAYSVEDSGDGVCLCVFAFNVQPGISIDYKTGESWETEGAEVGTDAKDYVLNTNTKKFHFPSCKSVDDMKEKNREYIRSTRDELIERGYAPCGSCKP